MPWDLVQFRGSCADSWALDEFNDRCVTLLSFLQDWLDIDFAIRDGVDFIAVSFVKSAEVINNLKSYLSSRADKIIEIIAKVESHDSVPNLEEIVAASDAVMVARGDLGKL